MRDSVMIGRRHDVGAFPPLVAPGPPLAPQRLIRYSRQLSLPGFDETAQRRLAAARVLVVGAGGLGSASIPYLASSGVGTIGVIDDDTVDLSNLHRQVMHGIADIGLAKTDSIARSVAAIDPETVMRLYPRRVGAEELTALVAQYDLVLDGSDNFETRYLCADACEMAGKPLVWGAILRFSGQVSVSWADVGPTYRDLYPVEPAPGEVPSCAEAGVIPGVCAVIGALMATEALKIVTGLGDPLVGRVTVYSALTGTFREIEYARRASEDEAPAESRPPERLRDHVLPHGPSKARVDPVPAEGSRRADTSRRVRVITGQKEPRRPAAPAQITVRQLAKWREEGTAFQLIDVREPYERRIAQIPGAEPIPLADLEGQLARVRHDAPVVAYCHVGSRSFEAVRYLRAHGYLNAVNLVGGIDAYAQQVDTTMARY
jgi:adenylyltransferase/sulfurtransferase